MSTHELRWWALCEEFLTPGLSVERKRAILRELKSLVVHVP